MTVVRRGLLHAINQPSRLHSRSSRGGTRAEPNKCFQYKRYKRFIAILFLVSLPLFLSIITEIHMRSLHWSTHTVSSLSSFLPLSLSLLFKKCRYNKVHMHSHGTLPSERSFSLLPLPLLSGLSNRLLTVTHPPVSSLMRCSCGPWTRPGSWANTVCQSYCRQS